MQGLKITNHIHWRDSWSQQIAAQLEIRDSSYDFLVFAPRHERRDVEAVLREIPREFYELIEVDETSTDNCELWTDAGQCYHRH